MRIARIIGMGKKKHNICSKCGVRHAAPTGKACLAGAGKQAEDKPIEDEFMQGGQAPNQVGLDSLCDPPDRRKAVSPDERIDKMERDMITMGGKLNLILSSMKNLPFKCLTMKSQRDGRRTSLMLGMR